MSVLVFAEHSNSELKSATLNAVTAAVAIGGDVHVLVAGHNGRPAAEAAAKVKGVAKVLLVDAPIYEHLLAETVAPLVQKLASGYSHVLATATTFGKNFMPRVAACSMSRRSRRSNPSFRPTPSCGRSMPATRWRRSNRRMRSR